MKKYTALALVFVLAASLFAGCRRNVGSETAAPTAEPTTNTTEHTTGTTPSTMPSTRPETVPNTTEMPTVTPDDGAIGSTEDMPRSRRMPRAR